MPPSRLVSPPRPLQHPARTTPGTASAAMAMVADTAAAAAAERIADRRPPQALVVDESDESARMLQMLCFATSGDFGQQPPPRAILLENSDFQGIFGRP
jgi:hypothetical protein